MFSSVRHLLGDYIMLQMICWAGGDALQLTHHEVAAETTNPALCYRPKAYLTADGSNMKQACLKVWRRLAKPIPRNSILPSACLKTPSSLTRAHTHTRYWMFGQNYPQMNPKNASDTFGTHWGRQRKQKQHLEADTKSGAETCKCFRTLRNSSASLGLCTTAYLQRS